MLLRNRGLLARVASQVVRGATTVASKGNVGTLGRVPLTGRNARTQQQLRSYNNSNNGPGGKDNLSFRELKTEWEASRMQYMFKRDPELAIRMFERGEILQTEATLAEYVKALVKVDRLDQSKLMSHLQRSVGGGGGSGSSAMQDAVLRLGVGRGASSLFGDGDLGSEKNPIYMSPAEPTIKTQFWKTIRVGITMFIAAAGLSVLLETSPGGAGGLSRGLMGGSPEPQPAQVSNVTFKDVKGVDEAKSELEEIVAYLRNPGKFTKLGGKLPKGVLLVGPPGTGKTMLAKAIAGEAGVPFFYASGSDFEEMFVGVGARRVRDLFAAAKRHSPCIIFLDEVDAIGGKRNPKDQTYQRMTLNQLLVELDGFKANEGVIVIAATNFASSLDNALVRPGRFDRTVTVSKPDVRGRVQVLESHFKGVARAPDVDLTVIARGTPGMSGADLANLVNVAALKAAQDDLPAVTMHAMEWAKDRILMGAERKSAVIADDEKRMTAYHEGGHALVALHTPGANPVHKATVMPRGHALGFVLQLPDKDELSISRRQLQARLDVAMAGRVAEELIFGKDFVTTGASSDLSYATRLAQDMVTKWGFSEDKVGLLRHDYQDRVMSPETKKIVEEETKVMLAAAYERAKKILTEKGDELELLAKAMIEKETLTGAEINELLAAHRKARSPTA